MTMGIFKRIVFSVAALLMFSVPSWAVFNEKNLTQTLQVLRYELCKAYLEMERNQMTFESQDDRQHEELVQLIQSNQLLVSAVAEQSRVTAEQSKVMALIVDQNSQLMASDDDDDDLGSKYLDS